MHVLYIYGGESDKDIMVEHGATVSSYHVGLGSVTGSGVNNINNSALLNDIALENSNAYSEYIYSQNHKFISQGLVFDSNLSLYFLSDLSCKRSELFSTYSDYCSAVLLKRYILENNVNQVKVDGVSHEFLLMVKSILGAIPCQSSNIIVKKGRLITMFARYFIFICKTIVSITLGKLVVDKNIEPATQIGNFFLTRYPLHLSNNLKEEKYGELANNGFFLASIITDGFHQNVSIIDFLKSLRKLSFSNRVYVLDRYLKVSDVLHSLVLFFQTLRGFLHLSKREFVLNSIDLSAHIRYEIIFSMLRIPRLLMWNKPLIRFVKEQKVESLYYYLHEYTYGRMFTYTFKNHSPNTCLIGFQHGPASMRKILYMAAKNELSDGNCSLNSFSVPDKVLAEDTHSSNIYKSAGYSNVQVMDKVYRLAYLRNISRDNVNPNLILIAPGLHDGKFLLEFLRSTILNQPHYQFILKAHPRADNRYVSNFLYLQNLEVKTSRIEALLSQVSKVYVTYSSIAIEASMLGIDVEVIDLPGRVNETPLHDEEFLSCIGDIAY